MRLLVVEDHDATRQVLARLLARAGHEVVSARGLNEAVKAAEGRHFDALLTDLGLPDGTGIQLMERLRASHHGMPGIALSGFGSEQDMRRTTEAGFVAHLVKPVDLGELHQALEKVHAGSGA